MTAYANTMHPAPAPRYQSPAVPVAVTGTFAEALSGLAGAALTAAHSDADRQAMHDLRRKEGRYQFRVVDRALDLVAQLPEAQFEQAVAAFCANVRSHLVKRRTVATAQRHDLTLALVLETEAQGEADNAQLAVVREVLASGAASPSRVMRAKAALSKQAAAIVRFLDDLACVPVRESAK